MMRSIFSGCGGAWRLKRLLTLCVGVAITVHPAMLSGQPCHGTPAGTSVRYERGDYQIGSANGVGATFAGTRVAAGADFAMREFRSDHTGQQANARFSIVLGSSRIQVCPGLRLGFARDTWKYQPGSDVTSTTLGASGGLNVGFEQPVFGEFSVTPFAGGMYHFAATAFSIGAPNSDTAVGGDTVSTIAIEYGLMGRFRFVYGGLVLDRTTDSKGINPDVARWVIGIAFSGRRRTP